MPEPKKPAVAPEPEKRTFDELVEGLPTVDLTAGNRLTRGGAALAVAHLLVVLGERKVSAMSVREAKDEIVAFLKRCPMAWSALLMGNPNKLVAACKMYGVECEDVAHYQREQSRLTPLPKMAGFPGPIPLPAS